MMKICEVCGVEEAFLDETEDDEVFLGLCQGCINDLGKYSSMPNY